MARVFYLDLLGIIQPVRYPRLPFGILIHIANSSTIVVLVRYLKFEDITFYNLSVYHYNLHDKQNCIITGYTLKRRIVHG